MRDAVLQLACVQRARERPQTKAAHRLLDSSLRLYSTARLGFLVMTAIASLLALSIIFIHRVLQSMSDDQLVLLGRGWSLDRLSVILLHFGACRVCFQLAGRRGVTVLKPLVFGNHLRAKQEDDAGDFEAQQPDNRGRQRAVDDADD